VQGTNMQPCFQAGSTSKNFHKDLKRCILCVHWWHAGVLKPASVRAMGRIAFGPGLADLLRGHPHIAAFKRYRRFAPAIPRHVGATHIRNGLCPRVQRKGIACLDKWSSRIAQGIWRILAPLRSEEFQFEGCGTQGKPNSSLLWTPIALARCGSQVTGVSALYDGAVDFIQVACSIYQGYTSRFLGYISMATMLLVSESGASRKR
jgi:hypothetical protein